MAFAAALLFSCHAGAATHVDSARIWPAEDYTRLTLESKKPLQQKLLFIENPDRLVLDLEGAELDGELSQLPSKVGKDDPYIKAIRIGRFKPGVIRIVLDLKAKVSPQIFSLAPIADYGNRLVLDIYPSQDALMGLLSKPEKDAPKLQEKSRPITIAVDAGHGGEDPGAHGRNGTFEKNVTLAIARKLKNLIDDEPNMHAILTRDGDYFIPLHGRVVKARKAKADLFVSIHADASPSLDARGSSVFALSERGATSVAARWLAKRENESDLIGGVDLAVKDPYLAKTLLDLSQTASISDSLRLGKDILHELGAFSPLHSSAVEQAGFAVLKAPDIPSILVETAFISNPIEEKNLDDDAYREKVAGAIFDGIKHYFSQNPALARPNLVINQ
ncbi:MAG: N-acetylmuramoyl-L-alanine amidase [Burkholderiales bacterium]|nr:N-acetylmuramoyl-L-alanine amidase [Burkholderiales bacterium]